jgi:diguanylate cyclase (GGDEF)-like protein/PAS domain S-box-containing protein
LGRILVVEDDPLMGQDISLKLQQLGYEVVAVVASSEAAVTHARDSHPDLILMDIILEGDIDGIQTAQHIQQFSAVPIVFLTAYDDEDFIHRARITEPYGYVLKPYTARELHAVVSISLYKSQAERAIHQAAQVSSTLSSMSDPVLKVDKKGSVQMCNKAAECLLHFTQSEMLGKPIDSLFKLQWNGRGDNILQGLIESVFRQGTPLQIDQDLLLRGRKPPRVPVSLKINEIPDKPEAEGGAVLLIQDISERAAMQEELNLIAQVFKSSSEGILITDPQPRILRVNEAYLNITGYTLEEVVGRNPNILSSGYHDKQFYRELWQTLLETGSWSGEIWNRRKDGEIYPERLNITAVRDERGMITHYVGIFTDVSVHKRMQDRLNYLTRFDSLTGLANRSLFEDRASSSIQRAKVAGRSTAIMMLDIDNFNTINDVSGHIFGDQLLKEFAGRMVDVVQDEERLARFGGDVFALVVEENDSGMLVTELAQSLLDVLSVPFILGGKSVQLTASIGISVYPGDGDDVYELLKRVDNALHHAKHSGKNNYRFFDKVMYDNVLASRRIEQALRGAIERYELQLHYQPQVEIDSGKMRGCEALIRWQSPLLGQVYPGQFISIAEETGQIVSIGKWVLREACMQFHRWLQEGCTPSHIAVNVSARQFKDPEFVDAVKAVIIETNMQPENLMLEVTESVAMEQDESAIDKLGELKKIGVRLSLDDFGTGYSALSSLQRYPFDTLKIDRSFIVESLASEHGAVMLEAIIKMSEGLHLETIAEGVEELSQLQFLRALGCHLVQGYYYSHPVLGDEIGRMVLTGFAPYNETA